MVRIDTYTSFIAPNAGQLIDFVVSLDHDSIDNSLFTWGEKCRVDRIPILDYSVRDLIKPSVDYLLDLENLRFNYEMMDPWVNLYGKGGFQELHDHHEHDFVCVFFANSGVKFSNFFFFH